MGRIFFLTLSFFAILWGLFGFGAESQQISSPPLTIEQIDQKIEELKGEKRGYEARALRHEDQADRLQFDDQTNLETRRHIKLAEENRSKAAAIQKEIDRLTAEKEKLGETEVK